MPSGGEVWRQLQLEAGLAPDRARGAQNSTGAVFSLNLYWGKGTTVQRKNVTRVEERGRLHLGLPRARDFSPQKRKKRKFRPREQHRQWPGDGRIPGGRGSMPGKQRRGACVRETNAMRTVPALPRGHRELWRDALSLVLEKVPLGLGGCLSPFHQTL